MDKLQVKPNIKCFNCLKFKFIKHHILLFITSLRRAYGLLQKNFDTQKELTREDKNDFMPCSLSLALVHYVFITVGI